MCNKIVGLIPCAVLAIAWGLWFWHRAWSVVEAKKEGPYEYTGRVRRLSRTREVFSEHGHMWYWADTGSECCVFDKLSAYLRKEEAANRRGV